MPKLIGIIVLATLAAILVLGIIDTIAKFNLLTTPEGTTYVIQAQFLNKWEETLCDDTGCYQGRRLLVRLKGAILPTLLYSGHAIYNSEDNLAYPYCHYTVVNTEWGPYAYASSCGQTDYPEERPFPADPTPTPLSLPSDQPSVSNNRKPNLCPNHRQRHLPMSLSAAAPVAV